MVQLKRLTAAALRKAEEKGKAAGWYNLCLAGYLPAEVALYAEPAMFANEELELMKLNEPFDDWWEHQSPKPAIQKALRRGWRLGAQAERERVLHELLSIPQSHSGYIVVTVDELNRIFSIAEENQRGCKD